jgi:hypothetical protein
MNIPELTIQVSELRWLVSELGKELETLATTPYDDRLPCMVVLEEAHPLFMVW